MKQVEINNHLIVEVPGDAEIKMGKIDGGYYLYATDEPPIASFHVSLPPGSYTILAKGNEARGIVSANTNIYNTWFRDYCYKMGTKKPDTVFQFDNALESLHSFIRSHNMEPDCAIILLKNK